MKALWATAFVIIFAGGAIAEDSCVEKHVDVYKEEGRFGGWPANHGIWIWGNEILVGFSRGYYKDLGPERHNIDRERPEEHLLARSLDGGETWTIENPAENGDLIPEGAALHGTELPGVEVPKHMTLTEPIDFTHPDFAMTLRMTSVDNAPSRLYYSYDRGHTWEGPYRLPSMGTPGMAARTDYIVNGPKDCMLFLTAAKRDGTEGRPMMARTTDGGINWEFVSWIMHEPLEEGWFGIMPSTVRIDENQLVTAIRRREGPKRWNDCFVSNDNGSSWEHLSVGAESTGEGNPPSMIKLQDGRLALTYGYRAEPFEMRARISADNGKTWGEDIVLRTNGGGRDMGYPRTVQRPDGKVVTVYYWYGTDHHDRYIAATIWDPRVSAE